MGETQTPTPTPDAPKIPALNVASGTPKKKVLVVEDEKPLAHALEMKLTRAGYEVKTVMNGEEALEELKSPGYSMALLDLIMPKIDGFTVLSELKSQGVNVPVIVLSNLGQEEDRAKAKTLGAVQYFVKSNTPIADIISCVQKTLG